VVAHNPAGDSQVGPDNQAAPGSPAADIRAGHMTLAADIPVVRNPEAGDNPAPHHPVARGFPEAGQAREGRWPASADLEARRRRSSLSRFALVFCRKRRCDAFYASVVHHHLGDPLGIAMTDARRFRRRQILGRSLLLSSHWLSLGAFPIVGGSKR